MPVLYSRCQTMPVCGVVEIIKVDDRRWPDRRLNAVPNSPTVSPTNGLQGKCIVIAKAIVTNFNLVEICSHVIA